MPFRHSFKRLVLPAASAALSILFAPAGRGDITYHLNFDPASSPQAQQVANSVAMAAAFYNQHGSFNKHWSVTYHPGIPTAEGNYDGYMGYGGTRNERVVFHEAAHTFGMGTTGAYGNLIAGGVWKGIYGNRAQADTYADFGDGLHGDGHAIWPGGFNYDNEDGFIERIWHTRIMAGIRTDMGILSYTREARNEAVVAGETAEFQVEAPLAYAFQWHRNGVALVDGGDISGANTATLRIANAEPADAGRYHCVATGAGETLQSRARQLWVHASPQLGQWNFDGSTVDSVGALHGTAFGGPAYVAGKIGQAVDLDGTNDYIDLPDAVGRTADLTIATWVNWDGGGDWQRVFDFGTGTFQYLCLTPKAGGGNLRLVLKDSVNGKDREYQVNAPTLAIGQWVHVAVVLRGSAMTLYVNGKPVGSAFDLESSPAHFPATNNFIGKSQYNDPYFNGRVDDFRVYAKALTGAEVWSLWGQSANVAPVFSTDLVTLPDASSLEPYAGAPLAPFASDANSDALTFTKLHGPAWLTVAPNGTVSGQPGAGDGGENRFVVRVADPSGASSDVEVIIDVYAPAPAPVTSSATAPGVDGDDAWFYASNIREQDTIGGTTSAGANDESTYVAEDRSSKGQTFTTGANPGGYFLQAFTFQHVNWPALTPSGTFYDVQPGDQWEIQIGTLNGTTRTPIVKYSAVYDGPAITGSGTVGTGRYLTFNLTGLGVQLASNTTYYFEIAPLAGEPFLELNSSRNGTYAGGSAFRGSVAGTIAGNVNTLAGDYIFHASLLAASVSSPSTVAYWNFEEGTAGSSVPYERTAAGQYQGSIFDRSGNANHLSPWTSSWYRYRAQVPASSTSQLGVPNLLSIQNAGSFPAISATGTSLTKWSPTAWTIEAAIRPDDATNGYQTFIGRDSFGANKTEPALAALYFAITPNGGLRIHFTDVAGNVWAITSPANTIQDAKWHAVAATSTGSALSLYVKNLSDGEANYRLLGTVNTSASANAALTTGAGDGADWDAGVFSFTRGLYNGGHTDRYFGHLDDVRFSEGALPPSQFLYTAQTLTPAQSWRMMNFKTTANTGDAGDNADPDRDGLPNLLERAFGGNPKTPSPSHFPKVEAEPTLLTITYTRAKGQTDLTLSVEESIDPGLETWTTAVGNETVTDLGAYERVDFKVDPGTAGRKFLRVQAMAVP